MFLGVDENKKVYTWGRNNYGQCGTSKFSDFHNITTETVKGDEDDVINTDTSNPYVKCLAGSEHCLVLDNQGNVLSWGWNEHGNLGNGETNNAHTPAKINFDCDGSICDIFVGSAHCFAYSEK